MGVLWKLPECKSISDLLLLSFLAIDDIKENNIVYYDEVYSIFERKEIRLNICLEWIISREVESIEFATLVV